MMTKIVMSAGIAAASLMLSAGVAAAEPNVEAIVNSTCSYPQVMAALNDQSPDVANQISSNPFASGWLQQLVAAPPDARRGMIAQLQAMPEVAGYAGLINEVAGSCQNY